MSETSSHKQLPTDTQEHIPTDTQGVSIPDATAVFLDAFFEELQLCGVCDVVVSPGSRSTSLSMMAFERFGDVYVDVDERSAAFFALGLAKAKNKPVCVICTSGTAVGNWMPAVLEAESSRVPLIFLSSDRPARLQGVGAPQTCDQLKIFGDHVKKFVQMPLPDTNPAILSYARQMALELVINAEGSAPGVRSSDAGPVHANFPFDNPLKPTMGRGHQSSEKRKAEEERNENPRHQEAQTNTLPTISMAEPKLSEGTVHSFLNEIADKRVLAVCGEGCAETAEQAQQMVAFAQMYQIPLLADPLSGLRCVDDPLVIDNYDNLFDGSHPELLPQVIVRFGRWPVSKGCGIELGACGAQEIVVDMRDTRDMNSCTSAFIRCRSLGFVGSLLDVNEAPAANKAPVANKTFAQQWISANDAQRGKIISVAGASNKNELEGAYVRKLLELIPEHSLLFSASSMSIRALDTFYVKSNKQFTLLCNRGLNGIDGTVSSAIGAGQNFKQTTLLIGDLAMQHDANGLAFQNEMQIRAARGCAMPSISIVLLDNDGGAIFDILPQKSADDYFERLFLTPQNTDFVSLAAGYHVDAVNVQSVENFENAYIETLGKPGIHMVVVKLPLQGVQDRYKPYQ